MGEHLRDTGLRATFAIGFCILFAFIGTFTFVNFVLARQPLSLSRMMHGFVYFVFLPSILTTPLAGHAVARFGVRPTFLGGLALALIGLPLLLVPHLPAVLTGLALVGFGTFLHRQSRPGSSACRHIRSGWATGLYLASYFAGGLVGSAVLGQVFDRAGWPACLAGIGCALLAAIAAGFAMRTSPSMSFPSQAQKEMST